MILSPEEINGVYKDISGDSDDYYYYVNGEIQDITEVYKVGDTWYNLVKGMVVGDTVAHNSNGWWYANDDGIVDFTYTGFATNSNGEWYVVNSKVDFSHNSVYQDTTGAIGTAGTWYYVVGDKVQTDYTGVANYSNAAGWWYIKNGAVDFTANTVAHNNNGWWYVTGGKVQFGYTGLANYSNSNGWWYISSGKVDFSYNGLANNKNGWFYLSGGKVQFGYTGFAQNSYGKWYVQSGKVTFTANGTYTDTTGAIGTKGTSYKVVNSKVV